MKPQTGPKHFPSDFDYNYHNDTAIVECKIGKKTNLRKLDPWALCYKEYLESFSKSVLRIQMKLPKELKYRKYEFESFKRRISYLQLNNSKISFEIIALDTVQTLYNRDELLFRPSSEIIHDIVSPRNAEDTPGKLEKDFQAFLFGGTILDSIKDKGYNKEIYRRLGVLGADFYNLKNDYKVYREYPTGVFDTQIFEENRILSTYYIDILGFNKHKHLALIELKLNDPKLEAISQILDYALFGIMYKKQLCNVLQKDLCPDKFEQKPIACYLANNHFHEKLNWILKYYKSDNKEYGFSINMIELGKTTKI
jgi:hypothetical protein